MIPESPGELSKMHIPVPGTSAATPVCGCGESFYATRVRTIVPEQTQKE